MENQSIYFRTTNDDGRMGDFIDCEDFTEGIYKMVFNTKPFFKQRNVTTFYPYVEVMLSDRVCIENSFKVFNETEFYLTVQV